MSAPYLLRHTEHRTYWHAAAPTEHFGSWHFGTPFATHFPTRADAKRALRAIRIGAPEKSKIKIVALSECYTTQKTNGEKNEHQHAHAY